MGERGTIVKYVKIKDYKPELIVAGVQATQHEWDDYILKVVDSAEINDQSFLITSYYENYDTGEVNYVIGVISLELCESEVNWDFSIKYWNLKKNSNYEWKFNQLEKEYEKENG